MNQDPIQIFPALDAATEAALRASIERFGVIVPVVEDQHGRILDGHHRARIATELQVGYDRTIVQVADDDEAREYARTLNADRRHLTPEQRREVVGALREEGHSLRAIAGAVGISKSQVAEDVAQLSTTGHLTDWTPEAGSLQWRAMSKEEQRQANREADERAATRPEAQEQLARLTAVGLPGKIGGSVFVDHWYIVPPIAGDPKSWPRATDLSLHNVKDVDAYLARWEAAGSKPYRPPRVSGIDGKSYPATRPPKPKPVVPVAKPEPAALTFDEAVKNLEAALRAFDQMKITEQQARALVTGLRRTAAKIAKQIPGKPRKERTPGIVIEFPDR